LAAYPNPDKRATEQGHFQVYMQVAKVIVFKREMERVRYIDGLLEG
jgi:hypothetical protein